MDQAALQNQMPEKIQTDDPIKGSYQQDRDGK
jgi:hypothetical protein